MSIRVKYEQAFLRIINSNYMRLIDARNELDAMEEEVDKNSESNDEYFHNRVERGGFKLDEEIESCGLTCVVFTCTFLEEYIYTYAAESLSDTYVKKYLDKLDIVAKYVAIPKITSGSEIDKGGESLQLLREVVRMRNRVIHSKSKNLRSMDELYERYSELEFDYVYHASKCMKLVQSITHELHQLDSAFTVHFESYKHEYTQDKYMGIKWNHEGLMR